MNYYPEQLAQIATYIEHLNRGGEAATNLENRPGLIVNLGTIPVEDEDGRILGHLVDEVGNAWSFRPC